MNISRNSKSGWWTGQAAICGMVLSTGICVGQVSINPILPPEDGTDLSLVAFNNRGEVAGTYYQADGTQRSMRFGAGKHVEVGNLGGYLSVAVSLNNLGSVAGYAANTNGDWHAFLYQNGTNYDIGTFRGANSDAETVNDANQVVGTSDSVEGSVAFLYENGRMISLGTLGGSYSRPYGMNNLGAVVGEALVVDDATSRAFIYTNGIMVDLGAGDWSYANAINDAGQVIGAFYSFEVYDTRAFICDAGGAREMGTLGGHYSEPRAINKAGQVIGDSETSSNTIQGFIYQGGVMQGLGTLPGGMTSAPWAINNFGQIVGDADDSAGNYRAFIWENGVMHDLNEWLAPDSGWFLISAKYINDAGQIVGIGVYQGNYQWYILSLNRPPVCDAGPDQMVECPAMAVLNGSGSEDPDGDPITFAWYMGGTLVGTNAALQMELPLGQHEATLIVTDTSGAFTQDTVVIVVQDTTPPVLQCPAALEVVANENCQATVPDLLSGLTVSDACGAPVVKQVPAAGTVLGLGIHQVVVTATDTVGNASQCTVPVAVVDRTAPVIQGVAASPNQLTTGQKQLVPVTVRVAATDQCGGRTISQIVRVTSSQPVSGPGDKTTPDWVIIGPLSVSLRDETAGGSNRVYAITVETRDAAGNTTTATTTVTAVKREVKPRGRK